MRAAHRTRADRGAAGSRRQLIRLRAPAAGIVSTLTLVSCTASGSTGSTPAEELCHGSLSSPAVRAARVLGQEQEFHEKENVPFDKAARTLRANSYISTSRTVVCRVHAAVGGGGGG
ncbi:hypothetical protein, partial [Streptomyces boncukensis]